MKLKELFTKFEKAEEFINGIGISADENVWHEANVAERKAFCELASEIMNLIKCDRKTANSMIIFRRENLRALVARM